MKRYFKVNGRLVVGLIIVLGSLVGLIMAYAYLPKAKIVISPKQDSLTVEQRIILSSRAQEPDYKKAILPLKVIEKNVTTTETHTRTTGETFEDYAKGEVKLINKQASEQRLLPKTHLRHETSGVFFLTDEATIVPPQGEIKIKVTAKEKGARGNVPTGKFMIDKLAPSLQQVIWGESAVPFSGGTGLSTPLSQDELEKSKEEALKKVRERAEGQLSSSNGGKPLNKQLIFFTDEEVTASAEAGSQAGEYNVNAKTTGKALVVDDNDMLSLTLLKLRELKDEEKELLRYDPESFKLAVLQANFEQGEVAVKGELTGVFAHKISTQIFETRRWVGLTPAEVKERFREFPQVEEVEVTLSPFWVKTIPARTEAIEVKVEQD